jgi:hypothetical protein
MLPSLFGALLGWLAVVGPADDYGADAARRDADTILRERGPAYTQARARLEAHPTQAAAALSAQLGEPLGPAERERVLSILAGFRDPALVPTFADALRRARLAGGPMEPWRNLLLDQGAAAAGAFAALVADTELGTADRALFLDDLVQVTPGPELGSLATSLASGSSTLRGHLRRALARRARSSPEDAHVLHAALAELFAGGTASEQAAAIQMRAAMTDRTDPAEPQLRAWLVEAAIDEAGAFVVRVAALRALADRPGEDRDAALSPMVRRHLAPAARGAQASEILGWLALSAMDPVAAAPAVAELDLWRADAPRLATLAFQVATPPGGEWLADSGRHPWPQVRAAALDRVQTPCSDAVVGHLARTAGPLSRGGDGDAAVSRAAVAALGRCGDQRARARLLALLEEDGIGVEQRGAVARALVEHGGGEGTLAVARALGQAAVPALAERLAGALARTLHPSPPVHRALCEAVASGGRPAATARASLDRVFPGEPCQPRE